MNADLVSTSLGVHGTVFAASMLAMWKLGGESKFGTEKISDLHLLRPKVLKATVLALESALTPILTAGGNSEPTEFDESGNPKPKPAKLSVDGKEALTNSVRDFIKGNSAALVDLCQLNALDSRLTGCMKWLRTIVYILVAVSVLFCGLMATAKFEWIEMTTPAVHFLGFAAIALLIVGAISACGPVLFSSSQVEQLKSRYVDLYN